MNTSADDGKSCVEPSSRLIVVGTPGSGKTTVAQRLSNLPGTRHGELDALHRKPNWTKASADAFRQRVEEATHGDRWVSAGNYSQVRDILWSKGTTIVWLNYSFWVIMRRLIWRTLRRTVTRDELWNGNRERLLTHLFSKESIFLWALQTHWRRRRTYLVLFGQPEYSHLEVVDLRSPKATDHWLQTCCSERAPEGERRTV